ncbi:MAG: HXXEE domain-containing protein, partial [Mycobacterium sp.]
MVGNPIRWYSIAAARHPGGSQDSPTLPRVSDHGTHGWQQPTAGPRRMISPDAQQPAITLPSFRKVVWLMPAAYFLHIIEEYVGGFPAWVTHDVHGSFDDTAFAVNNIAFMLILLTLVYVNYRESTPLRGVLLMVFASANLFWDALFHLVMTPILNRYSPGLVTAMLLYYPICILVGTVIIKDKILTPRQFVLALLG